MWFLLKLAAVAAAIMYIGGSIKGKLKLALFGAAVLGILFAISSLFLLHSHSYLLGGTYGVASVIILGAIVRPSRRKSKH